MRSYLGFSHIHSGSLYRSHHSAGHCVGKLPKLHIFSWPSSLTRRYFFILASPCSHSMQPPLSGISWRHSSIRASSYHYCRHRSCRPTMRQHCYSIARLLISLVARLSSCVVSEGPPRSRSPAPLQPLSRLPIVAARVPVLGLPFATWVRRPPLVERLPIKNMASHYPNPVLGLPQRFKEHHLLLPCRRARQRSPTSLLSTSTGVSSTRRLLLAVGCRHVRRPYPRCARSWVYAWATPCASANPGSRRPAFAFWLTLSTFKRDSSKLAVLQPM
mmetsp:Transcript_1992/g.5472  ORF Transcript_1992/g.5472 Transcript_1992/m.5472 type:complete len:273 (-) Transcript_1992:643-1461(-)